MEKMRRLRPNHSCAVPTQLITVAVKTKPFRRPGARIDERLVLDVGFAQFARIEYGNATRIQGTTFTVPRHFWQWVCNRLDPRRTTWVVCVHAGITYQSLALFTALDNGTIALDYPHSAKRENDPNGKKTNLPGGLFCVSDPPTIIGIKSPSGNRATLIDIRNYGDLDWTAIHEALFESQLSETREDGTARWPAEILGHKCELLQRYFLGLLKEWKQSDFGMWRWTVGGLAMAAFRHRFMTTAPVFHDDKQVRKLERESYRAGDIICNRVGLIEGRSTQVDVNSLYPHVMRCGWFPSRLLHSVVLDHYRAGPPPGDAFEMIADVVVDTHGESMAIKSGNGMRRVRGRFPIVLAGPELDRYVRAGQVLGWKSCAVYKLAPLFRAFVDGLEPLLRARKSAGDKVGAKFIKGMLVSLYGKFGQMGSVLQPRPSKQAIDAWRTWRELSTHDGITREFISIGYQVFEAVKNDDNPNTLTAIPAFVCSYGREYMRAMRQLAGESQVHYQSCDSMIITDLGFSRLSQSGMIDETAIGKLKIEAFGNDVTIDGCHEYRIGDKVVAGWRSYSAFPDGNGGYEQRQTESLNVAARHEPIIGCPVGTIVKMRNGNNNQGIVRPDGVVEPHLIDLVPEIRQGKLASAAAIDSAMASILAGKSAGGTGGDCSIAITTALTD